MSLRIAFVAPFGLRHKTTVWARTLPIAQELVAAGHQATILVPPWDSPEDAEKDEVIDGVRVQQFTVDGGPLATVRRLLQAVEQSDPHIVHVVKPRAHAGMAQWWLWTRRRAAAPKILLDVDDWEQAWNQVNRYNWFVARFMTWQEEWGIRHADGITAASRWLEQKVTNVSPHIPNLYLPNGVYPLPEVPPEVSSLKHAEQGPQVLFFTRYIEVAPEWLKEYWGALQSQVPTAQLIMAGTPVQPWLDAPYQASLAQMSHIQWAGYIQPYELRELYGRVTCAIFPATPVPLQQAKCSVRLATTLLHGVPVIASAVGEQANYGADGAARLVPADATPSEFANAVVEVIRNPAQPEELRKQATNRLSARYAWPRLTSGLIDFYHSILDKPEGK